MRSNSVRWEYRFCYTKRDWSFVKFMKVQKSIGRAGRKKTEPILRFFKVLKPKTLAKQISSIQKPKARRRRRAYCKKGAKLEDLVCTDDASLIFGRYTLRGKDLSIALSCPYDLPIRGRRGEGALLQIRRRSHLAYDARSLGDTKKQRDNCTRWLAI